MGGLDLAVELHMLPQGEFIGHEIQIAQIFRLAGKTLLPVPFIKQLAGEGVAIGITLGIETTPRIAVIVPCPAEIAAAFQQYGRYALIDKPLDLIDPGNARADDDHFIIRILCRCHFPAPALVYSCAGQHFHQQMFILGVFQGMSQVSLYAPFSQSAD